MLWRFGCRKFRPCDLLSLASGALAVVLAKVKGAHKLASFQCVGHFARQQTTNQPLREPEAASAVQHLRLVAGQRSKAEGWKVAQQQCANAKHNEAGRRPEVPSLEQDASAGRSDLKACPAKVARLQPMGRNDSG